MVNRRVQRSNNTSRKKDFIHNFGLTFIWIAYKLICFYVLFFVFYCMIVSRWHSSLACLNLEESESKNFASWTYLSRSQILPDVPRNASMSSLQQLAKKVYLPASQIVEVQKDHIL